MATINGTSIGGMTLQIDYSYTQNTTANTTSVTAKLQLVGHYALYATALSGSYISVGGSRTDYSTSISYDSTSATTTTVLATKTVTVSHNNDGTATCALAGAFVMNGTYRGYSVGTMTVSSTITLPTIPRSSGLTVATSVNTGSSLSGTVTPSSSSFNHKVELKVGSTVKQTITLATGTNTFSATIPHSWFPSSTSGTVVVVLSTYNGTTLIATTTQNVTANVPSTVVPAISALTAASSVTSGTFANLYVQGKTTAKLTATATAGDGSTISSYTYSGLGINSTVTTNTATTSTLASSGSQTYTVTVKDARGRTASKTVSITVYPYAAPTISSVSVQRCDSSGNLSDSGTYAKYTVNSTYSTVNSKNTRTVTAAYSSDNGSTYSAETTLQATTDTANAKTGTYGGGSLVATTSYVIRFTIKDAYGATATITAPLQSAARPMNIKSNGKGVAFGKMAETDNLLDVSWGARVRGNLAVDGTETVTGNTTLNGTLTVAGATTVNNSLTTTGLINAKNSINMGGLNGQTGELVIRFSNPTTSTYPHNSYLYGGNPNATTAMGGYDGKNGRMIWNYNDVDNVFNIGPSNLYIGGTKMVDFVVETGSTGIWDYRKWNSGDIECWGNMSVTPTTVNGTNTITVTLPCTFANTSYKVDITPAKTALYIGSFGDCNSSSNLTHTTTNFTMAYKYTNGTAYNVSFNLSVRGKWK